MRIRTQLVASAALAGLVTILLVVGLLHVTRQAQAGLDEQLESQQVARDVANLLSLTNEVTVFGGERAVTDWRTRHAQLRAAIGRAMQRHEKPPAPLAALRRNVDDLPALFEKLAQIGEAPSTSLAQRRRDLLLERLLIEMQEVVESRHRWAVTIAEAQQSEQYLYTAMVLAAPAALMLLLVSLGILIGRRVLAPLTRLEVAVAAIQGGDLSVRCASDSADELGDTTRAVDAMALALQQQSAALRASEEHFRLLADSLPALIGYIDTEQRYTFVNAHVGRIGAGDPASMLGRTMRDVRSAEAYEELAPHIARVLAGQTVNFENTLTVGGRLAHRQSTYVPDIDESGRVRGFYAMAFDVTERKEAELAVARVERQLRGITDNLPVLISYLDNEERYVFLNATFKAWLGIEPASVIGCRLADVVGGAEYEQQREPLRRALAGERVDFSSRSTTLGVTRSLHNAYIPDVQTDGSVLGVFGLSTDVTAMKDVEQQLSRLARLDALTGLPNRRLFEETLVEAIARASRDGKPMALMFLDIDHFKAINDSLGHGAGDAVLKEFASRLKRAVRVTDKPARLAGDEFVVLLEGLRSASEAERVTEKVVGAIRKPFVVDGATLLVTTSVGVAYCARPVAESALMACADEALYAAKDAGRNTFRLRKLEADATVSDPPRRIRGQPA